MQTATPEITRVLLQRCAELEQRTRMSDERWNAVDRYVTDLLVPSDAALDAALAANAAAGLPPHDVSPAQGRLLELLVRMRGARRASRYGSGPRSRRCRASPPRRMCSSTWSSSTPTSSSRSRTPAWPCGWHSPRGSSC